MSPFFPLTWDHPASEPTQVSTPAAQPLIDRFEQLYPQVSRMSDAAGQEPAPDAQGRRQHAGPDVRQLVSEMAALIAALAPALKRRAADLAVSGKDTEVVGTLLKGADAVRDSGFMYLTWARHYAALADGHGEGTEETDGSKVLPG